MGRGFPQCPSLVPLLMVVLWICFFLAEFLFPNVFPAISASTLPFFPMGVPPGERSQNLPIHLPVFENQILPSRAPSYNCHSPSLLFPPFSDSCHPLMKRSFFSFFFRCRVSKKVGCSFEWCFFAYTCKRKPDASLLNTSVLLVRGSPLDRVLVGQLAIYWSLLLFPWISQPLNLQGLLSAFTTPPGSPFHRFPPLSHQQFVFGRLVLFFSNDLPTWFHLYSPFCAQAINCP